LTAPAVGVNSNILIDLLRSEAKALASVRLGLATGNNRDFPLALGGVLQPYGL
jgi:hypothetical protein